MNNRASDRLGRLRDFFGLEINVQLERTQKSNHDFLVLLELVWVRVVDIVASFASQIYLFRILQESLALLICQAIVLVGLLQIEYFCEHRHVEFLVYWHILIEDLCGFLREFIAILSVEKGN